MNTTIVAKKDPKVLLGGGEAKLNRGWIVITLLAVVIAFAGGASRFDAIQIAPLRAISVLLLITSSLLFCRERIRGEGVLIVMLGSLTLLVGLQLVPLPPWLWQSLPQRGAIAQLDTTLSLEGGWRPLSMAPMRTSNVLGSLVVPAAALLLAIAFSASSKTILQVLAGLGVLNAFLGLLQIVTGRYSSFYFYEVTNRGSPVGMFANENHAGVFAACSMLVVTFLGLKEKQKPGVSVQQIVYAAAFLLILFVSLVGGSRAGLMAAVGAILVSLCMLALSIQYRHGQSAGPEHMRRWSDISPSITLFIPIGVVSLTAASFLALDRVPAFRDLIAQDGFEDLRWSIWPVIINMLKDHWFVGAGFGTFEQIYHIYEPSTLLMPLYVNQAHNDWVQYIIEGGVLSGLLLIGLFAWFAKRIAAIAEHRALRPDAIFWTSIFAIVGAASVIDYPLRTPLFQVVTIWLLVALSRAARDAMRRKAAIY